MRRLLKALGLLALAYLAYRGLRHPEVVAAWGGLPRSVTHRKPKRRSHRSSAPHGLFGTYRNPVVRSIARSTRHHQARVAAKQRRVSRRHTTTRKAPQHATVGRAVAAVLRAPRQPTIRHPSAAVPSERAALALARRRSPTPPSERTARALERAAAASARRAPIASVSGRLAAPPARPARRRGRSTKPPIRREVLREHELNLARSLVTRRSNPLAGVTGSLGPAPRRRAAPRATSSRLAGVSGRSVPRSVRIASVSGRAGPAPRRVRTPRAQGHLAVSGHLGPDPRSRGDSGLAGAALAAIKAPAWAATHINPAVVLTKGGLNIGRALVESPSARRETVGGLRDLPAGIVQGTAAAVQHPGRTAEAMARDIAHRYGPLLAGDTKKFRRRIEAKHSGGAVPFALDATLLGAGASTALGRAARAGAFGKTSRAGRLMREPRPALRYGAGRGEVRPQELSTRIGKAVVQKHRDTARARYHAKQERLYRAGKRPHRPVALGPGEVASRGGMTIRNRRVAPLPARLTAEGRLQPKVTARAKSRARTSMLAVDHRRIVQHARHVHRMLNKHERIAARYVYGGLVSARRGPEAAIAHIDDLIRQKQATRAARAEAGTPVRIPRSRLKSNDEVKILLDLREQIRAGKVDLGKVREASKHMRRVEVSNARFNPRLEHRTSPGRVSQAQLRRYEPVADVLEQKGLLPTREAEESLGSYIERVKLRRVVKVANEHGLERPGYFPSQRNYRQRFSDRAVGGAKPMPEHRRYSGELARTGREDPRLEVWLQGMLRGAKERHNVRLMADVEREHGIDVPMSSKTRARVEREARRRGNRQTRYEDHHALLAEARRQGGQPMTREEEAARVRGLRAQRHHEELADLREELHQVRDQLKDIADPEHPATAGLQKERRRIQNRVRRVKGKISDLHEQGVVEPGARHAAPTQRIDPVHVSRMRAERDAAVEAVGPLQARYDRMQQTLRRMLQEGDAPATHGRAAKLIEDARTLEAELNRRKGLAVMAERELAKAEEEALQASPAAAPHLERAATLRRAADRALDRNDPALAAQHIHDAQMAERLAQKAHIESGQTRVLRDAGPVESRAQRDAAQTRIQQNYEPQGGRTPAELMDDLEHAGIDPGQVRLFNPGRVFRQLGENDVGISERLGRALEPLEQGSRDISGAIRGNTFEPLGGGAMRRLSDEAVHTAEAYNKSRGWVAIPKRVMDELESGYRPEGVSARVWDITKGKFARLMLGWGNVSWLGFQVASNAFLAGITGVGPVSWVRAQMWWSKLKPEERSALEPYLGAPPHLADYERKMLGSHGANSWLVHAADAWRESSIGQLGRHGNPADLLFRTDQAQNRFFRRALLYNRAKRTALQNIAVNTGELAAAGERLVGALRRSEMDVHVNRVLADTKAAEHHAELVDRILGDYHTYTAAERRFLQRFVMFYGFLRHSLRLAFWTLPTEHPIVTSILGKLALMGAQESRELLGGDQLPWGLGKLYWKRSGQLMEIDLQRLNPATNALTEIRSTRDIFRLLPPFVGAAFETTSNIDPLTGKKLSVRGVPGGFPTDRKKGSYPGPNHYTVRDYAKVWLAQMTKVVPPLRYGQELKFHGPQGADASIIVGARPLQYRDQGVRRRIRQETRRRRGVSTGDAILQAILPFYPQASFDREIAKSRRGHHSGRSSSGGVLDLLPGGKRRKKVDGVDIDNLVNSLP